MQVALTPNMKMHKEVVLLLPKTESGKIILSKRAKDKEPYPNTWVCAVGGKVEKDESPERAILREMMEEIGATAEVKRVGEVIFDSEELKQVKLILFTTNSFQTKDLILDEREVQYIQEFRVEELENMVKDNPSNFAPTFIKIFNELVNQNKLF